MKIRGDIYFLRQKVKFGGNKMIVEKDCKVKIHYNGKTLDDAYKLSTEGRDPIEFTVGQGQAPMGLENRIMGMREGEKKVITLNPDEGFGPKKKALIARISTSDFSDYVEPKIGLRYKVRFPNGNIENARVVSIDDDMVTLDANHQLAGRTVKLELEIVQVE
jgi:FKBP-type peptidyl-prolyl cis-trans isomerase 2